MAFDLPAIISCCGEFFLSLIDRFNGLMNDHLTNFTARSERKHPMRRHNFGASYNRKGDHWSLHFMSHFEGAILELH